MGQKHQTVHQKSVQPLHTMKMSLDSDCATIHFPDPLHPGRHNLMSSSLQWYMSGNVCCLYAKVLIKLVEILFPLPSYMQKCMTPWRVIEPQDVKSLAPWITACWLCPLTRNKWTRLLKLLQIFIVLSHWKSGICLAATHTLNNIFDQS